VRTGFAGADRLQDGMRLSFGKPIGTAARINRQGDIIMILRVPAKHLEVGKQALEIARSKLPLKMRIEIVPLAKEAPAQ